MIELLIAACLASGECRDFPLLYDPYEVSMLTCVTSGQAEVARWQTSHPEWRIVRWRCGVASASERSA
jgi:hypothetical protein